ncbi:integrase, partial [Providencia manganoxydans]
WIEMQLAHKDKNSIRGTYNHAQYLEGRREMMQWYADYIDSLESQNKVISK